MHHPTDRIAHTTAFVTPVVEHWLEREIAQWVHPMKDAFLKVDRLFIDGKEYLPQSYTSRQPEHYSPARNQDLDKGAGRSSEVDGSSGRSFMGWTH